MCSNSQGYYGSNNLLSPAAQAVRAAAEQAQNHFWELFEKESETDQTEADTVAAAALRAAADALVAHEYWDRYPAIFYRKKLLAIATELENTNA